MRCFDKNAECSKMIVGGDAHIAPEKRSMLQRADVGIGPYGYLF